ncbi:iron(III) transport system substrate-binding protein [Bacillus mesophilus]|uniref:Fe(3+) ABC transporter substrate-binding protein n=1 Tax=Bacillus mesophilus TaxID=1808955 RepID=A0A6M0QA38_9BACI|nr:Fe(3+) ABC transporter substrate-binding protein [Bacillus mesophilus]MBM7662702.1 iron(III) transport system substrate-binding protein [Bacillus mesophilus]NEY73236.1 Fe(3+) ABC transporter substrate-binding protein [Bacillus mesophilus]
MKKSSFLWSSVFALLLVFSLLAGCSSTEETATPAEEKVETKTEETTAATEETKEDPGELNLYTARHYDTDDAIYAAFTEETGIKVNVIKGEGDELMERLTREGEATQGDVFITVDAGNLHRAKEQDLFQPIVSETVNSNIPAKLRDADNQWVALTQRARVIVYSKDRVNPSDLSTYEALTDAKWQGKVLIRSSENIYNQSLLASFLELNGEEKAKEWATGIVANMAREPKGGDTDQIKAVVAGEGDVAISNTYYVGRLINSTDPEDVKVAEQVGVFFPNQDTNGTHVNVSGIGLLKHAKNTENAVKFIEFMTSAKAQGSFAEGNNEYPANPSVEASETLKSWGEFKTQEIDMTILGEKNADAVKLYNEVGWK